MPTLTSCPSCAKQLKVPDELVGRQVKCPACGTTFTAAAESAPPPIAPMTPSAPSPEYAPRRDDYGQYDQGIEPRPSRKASNLFGPGIAMLISAILSLLVSGWMIVEGGYKMVNPEAAAEGADVISQLFKKQKATEEEKLAAVNQAKILGPIQAIGGVVDVLLAIVTMIGSVSLMKGRKTTLGWVAAIISVIPCTAPCCCAGIPVGIWAMIALNKAGQA